MSYKAKRIAIAVAAAVALFTAASVGTYFYIKGNESAQATENTEQVSEQSNNSNTQTPENNNNPETTENTQKDEQPSAQDNSGAQANAETNNRENTTTTTTNEDATTSRTRNDDGTTTTVTTNPDGTATTTVTNLDGTVISQTTDANVVTEYEEEERLVSKDDWVGWRPEAVPVPAVARIAKDLGINKYKINVEKNVISSDLNEDGKYDLFENITYQVKVSNIGNTTLTGIKISDKVNDRENIQTMFLTDENHNLINKIDDISDYTFDLEAGKIAYFEYTYTVQEVDIIEGAVKNSVTITTEKTEDTDTITTETEEIKEDYTVTKVADKKEVKAGDIVTYTITVKNTGNVTLNDVKVDDEMINLHEVINGLKPNAETSFTGTYEVTQADIDAQKVITNTVTVGDKTTTEEITPEPENKDYTVTKVADKKEVKAGDIVTYTITVKNTGNVTLNDVKVDDEMINLHEVINGLKPNAETSFTGTYEVTQADIDAQKVITNTVTVGDKTTTEEITPEPENKDYTVTKVADKKENVKAGDIVTYTITVKNTGNVTLNDVKVDDEMINLHEVINGLKPNAETSFTGTYEVTQADIDAQKVITNTVTVGDKTTTEEITPEAENKDYTVTKTAVVTRNGVEVTDKDENGNIIVKAGDVVTYTITVKNTGNVTLTGLKLTDEMLGITEQELGDIGVGKSTEVTGTHIVLQEEIDNQKPIVNTAKVGDKEDTEIVVPEKQVSISGKKTWNDENNKYKLRPDTITINLLANGTIKQSKEVKATDNWQYTFANLPKYDSNNREITYTITENELTDYTTQVNGYNVANTIKPVIEYQLKTNTGEVIKKPINYILVIDTSSSMNSDIDNNTYVYTRDDTNHPNSRIVNAENAVKQFVQYLYTTNTTADTTQVTLISFNSNASKYKTYNKDNYQDASSLYLSTHTGTNIQDGLKVAGDNLSNSMDNVIILLSDGEPSNGTYRDEKTLGDYARTIEQKQTGDYNTSIYTIAFGSDLANGGNGTKILKAISTDGKVLSSNSTDELIENLNDVQEKLTPGVAHYTTSGIIDTLYSGTTPLKKISFTAKAKNGSHTDISQEYTISSIHDGNNGVFIYHTSTNSNGETVYTLGIDFSQYLNDYEDFEVTYFVNNTLTKNLKRALVLYSPSKTVLQESMLDYVDKTEKNVEYIENKEEKSTTVEEPSNNKTVDSIEEKNNDDETNKEDKKENTEIKADVDDKEKEKELASNTKETEEKEDKKESTKIKADVDDKEKEKELASDTKETEEKEDKKESTEIKADVDDKEKELASDTKETEEKEDEKLVPEKDTDSTESNQTEIMETNEVIEENPNIITTEIIESPTE